VFCHCIESVTDAVRSVKKDFEQAAAPNGDLLAAYIGCLCMGKPDFAAIQETDDDPDFFCKAMGINRIPSPEIMRQRLDEIGDSMRQKLLWENTQLFLKNKVTPSKLPCGCVPVDIDVTPCDNSKTKKEGVSRTYKGCDGYAPIMAYIGREGYLVNCELREGKQHCQKPIDSIYSFQGT